MAQVNKAAETTYLDGLDKGYIDIDAFHLAYDDILTAAGSDITDLFYRRGVRKLKGRGTYGMIKAVKDIDDVLYNALISLWLAQFKNDMPIKGERTEEDIEKEIKEVIEKSVEILNRAKHTNFIVDRIVEIRTKPSFAKVNYFFPNGTFHVLHWSKEGLDSPIVPAEISQHLDGLVLPKGLTTRDASIMKIMTWLGKHRNSDF